MGFRVCKGRHFDSESPNDPFSRLANWQFSIKRDGSLCMLQHFAWIIWMEVIFFENLWGWSKKFVFCINVAKLFG